MLGGNLVQHGSLGVALELAGVKRVEGNDELEGRQAGSELQQDGDVRKRAGDAGELGMVDDVFGRVRAEGLVEGDAVESLGGKTKV